MESTWSIFIYSGEEENYKQEEKVYTFDEIRKMTDEELFDFLTTVYTEGMEGCCYHNN